MSAIATEPVTGYELKITRTFDAPRELVWKAWTDPEMAMHWMGPRGFQAREFVTPTEPGQPWHLSMEGHIPGTDQKVCLRQGGVVKEIKPPELLVYTFAWDSRESVGLGDSPYKENIVTVRLEERGGKTVMHFTQAPFATAAERDGHTGGWNSAFDRFAEFMLTKQPGHVPPPGDVPSELHMKRVFAAPRQMVFDAWTKPEIVAQWWGPAGFTTPVCEIDARNGGALRIHMRGPDGTIYPENQPSRVNAYNAVLRKVAAGHPGVVFINNVNKTLDPQGHFTATINGVTVRYSDGIHITIDGGILLRPTILPQIDSLALDHPTS